MGTQFENPKKVPEIKQFTQSEVNESISSLPGINQDERNRLLRDANQIFNPKSSNRLEGSNHEKLSEADILNQLRLNDPSISDEVLQKIDSRLDTSQKSFQKLSDVKVVVLETNLQNQNDPGAHSRIVSSIAQNNNSNLKPENIIHLGLREAGGTVEGLKSAADLSRRIQSEGGKPPVVNMSLEVGSMTDLNPDDTGIESVGDIQATALGYPANVTAGEMAKDPADLRRRLTELANEGDANAKQTLAEADALLELADTGAKVNGCVRFSPRWNPDFKHARNEISLI